MADEQNPEQSEPAASAASGEPVKPAASKSRKPRRSGQPSSRKNYGVRRSFDDQNTRRLFFRALGVSGNVTSASAIAGINRLTVLRECQRDPLFAADVDAVRNAAKHTWIECLVRAAEGGNAKAAMFLLERQHHNEFGRREPDEVTTERFEAAAKQVIKALWPLIPHDKQEQARASIETIIESAATSPSPQANGDSQSTERSAVSVE